MADGSMGKDGLSAEEVFRSQRTPQGLRYEKLRDELRASMLDPKFREKRDRSVREMRTVTPGQVHKTTFMSNMSVQYRNDDYIGEQLMPVLPVAKRNDSFPTYAKRERLGEIDDAMTQSSDANEIAQGRGEDSYVLKDYGLSDFLPAATVENEDPAFDEMMDLTEGIMEQLALNREIRHATTLTTAANYGTNTATLSGSDQWNSSAGGNPIKNMQDGLATCWNGRGPGDFVGFCSIDVANVLVRHPLLLDLFKHTTPGLSRLDMIARELGLAKILVGAARKDTANSNQTESYSRIWGNHFGIVRVARRPTLRNASFGFTIRMSGHPVTHQWFDPKKGVIGSYMAKVGVSEVNKVVAGTTGYLFVNAIA